MDRLAIPAPRPIVDERLVARLWDSQHSFALPLRTTSGEEVGVVYRGRRRFDRGADFTNALIALPGEELCLGDIEIHTRASDWRAHGHNHDPHYNSVILHVVLWEDGACPVYRQDGRAVPTVALGRHLLLPIDQIASQSLDTFPVPSPCWSGSLDGDGDLVSLLDRCGLERFDAKAARFEADLTCRDPDQLLYEGIATALGYSENRVPFLRLAVALPVVELLAALSRSPNHRLAAEALLFGASGLLPAQRGLGEPWSDERVERLQQLWERMGGVVECDLREGDWQFFRVRPANSPTRRIAALAGVVAEWPAEGMAERLASMARSVPLRRLASLLEGLLPRGSADPYWSCRYDFGLALPRSSSLIGSHRAAEIAINAFLPFLAAWASRLDDYDLGRKVRQLFLAYPKRGDNELSRYMSFQIAAASRPRFARSACRQQGLLQLYRRYCEEKRCGSCPVQSVGGSI